MTTYTIECDGFTGTGLTSVKAVQVWLDDMKARYSLKGCEVRVYRFIDGRRRGARRGVPELIGVVS